MKKNTLLLLILILAAASAVFCGTCHAEGEDECKITVEGGYASEPTSYGNVDYCWDLPKDQRIVSVTLRKKTYKGTYREETRAWNAIAYKGETPDGRITWQSRDVISDGMYRYSGYRNPPDYVADCFRSAERCLCCPAKRAGRSSL